MALSKNEIEYLICHHMNIIEEHKKGIRWHEDAIRNQERRITELKQKG